MMRTITSFFIWSACGPLLLSQVGPGQSQVEINATVQASFDKLDAKLNKSYKDLLERNDNDPSFATALKEAQRAWLKYVELHMNSVFPLAEGENPGEVYGSNYTAEYLAEKSKLFQQRIEILEAMTKG